MTGATITQRFRDFVAARFGLRFDDDKLDFLRAILERRAEARSATTDRYVLELAGDDLEAANLGSELTVGETYFFRNLEQFDALQEIVLPERMAAIGGIRQMRLLSAGCSSGEEPYSLAMVAHAANPDLAAVSIRAVDLNPAALQRAAVGRYGNWSLRETPPDMLSRWFNPQGHEVELDPSIRDAVRFERSNLACPQSSIWEQGPYDIIFCRNVIMYFTADVQRAVVARITDALVPGGYLFLGHAETLRGLSHDFHLIDTHGTFCYRRRDVADAQTEASLVQFPARQSAEIAPLTRPSIDAGTWFDSIGEASRRIENLARPRGALGLPAARPSAPAQSGTVDILALLAQERFADALALMDRLPSHLIKESAVLLLRAILLVQGGDCQSAAVICRSLIARDEHDAGAYYVLGLCLEATGDAASALLQYDIAAHVDPLFAMPFLRRGLSSRRFGQAASARADLSRALDLLESEDSARLLLFGGGFTRAALQSLCLSELAALGAAA